MFTLLHGTTLYNARLLIRDGPNPAFPEFGGSRIDYGFSAYLDGGPYIFQPPEEYARGKVRQYLDARAGGRVGECPERAVPVILVIEHVPDAVVAAVVRDGWCRLQDGVLEFYAGAGLEELRAAWPALTFTLRDV